MPKRNRRDRVKITWATANVGRGVPTPVAALAIRHVIRTFALWARVVIRRNVIIGWQEIDEDDAPPERQQLRRYLRELLPGARLAGRNTAVPITIPGKGWTARRGWADRISTGVPKWTPNRYLVAVLLEHDATGIRLLALNYHLARKRPDLHAWEHGNDTVERLIAERYLPMGIPILASADRNSADREHLGTARSTEHELGEGIDSLRLIIPQGCDTDVEIGPRKSTRIGIDRHRALGVRLTLRKRAAA